MVNIGATGSKEHVSQGRKYKRHRFNPWKVLWRRERQPTLVFLSGEFYGQKRLVVYSPQGCKESDAAEAMHASMNTHTYRDLQHLIKLIC